MVESRTWKGARTPQALKRVRQELRRSVVNRRSRSEAKTLVQRATNIALGRADGDAPVAVTAAISALDKAAEKGMIHPNNAARRKSRLMAKVNAAHLLDAWPPTACRREAQDDRQQDGAAQEGAGCQGIQGRRRQGNRSAAHRGRQGQGGRDARPARVGSRATSQAVGRREQRELTGATQQRTDDPALSAGVISSTRRHGRRS